MSRSSTDVLSEETIVAMENEDFQQMHFPRDELAPTEGEFHAVIFIKQLLAWQEGQLVLLKLLDYLKETTPDIQHATGLTCQSITNFVSKNSRFFQISDKNGVLTVSDVTFRKKMHTMLSDLEEDSSDMSESSSDANEDDIESTRTSVDSLVQHCVNLTDSIKPKNIASTDIDNVHVNSFRKYDEKNKSEKVSNTKTSSTHLGNLTSKALSTDRKRVDPGLAQAVVHLVTVLLNKESMDLHKLASHIEQAPEEARQAVKNYFPSTTDFIKAQSYNFHVNVKTNIVNLQEEVHDLNTSDVKKTKNKGTNPLPKHCIAAMPKPNVSSQNRGTIPMPQLKAVQPNVLVSREQVAERDSLAYFLHIVSEKGPLEMKRLVGYISQAKQSVKDYVGTKPKDISSFIDQHTGVFSVNAYDMISLKANDGSVCANITSSEDTSINGSSSSSISTMNSLEVFSPNEFKSISFFREVITKKGGHLSMKNLVGHISAAPSLVVGFVGSKLQEIKDFITNLNSVFSVDANENVSLVDNKSEDATWPDKDQNIQKLNSARMDKCGSQSDADYTYHVVDHESYGTDFQGYPDHVAYLQGHTCHMNDMLALAGEGADIEGHTSHVADCLDYTGYVADHLGDIGHVDDLLGDTDHVADCLGHTGHVTEIYPTLGMISMSSASSETVYFDITNCALTDQTLDLTTIFQVGDMIHFDAVKVEQPLSQFQWKATRVWQSKGKIKGKKEELGSDASFTDVLVLRKNTPNPIECTGMCQYAPDQIHCTCQRESLDCLSHCGYIQNVHSKVGFINYAEDDEELVFFDVGVCQFIIDEQDKLSDVVKVGDKVFFNADLCPEGVKCKWKATKVWLSDVEHISVSLVQPGDVFEKCAIAFVKRQVESTGTISLDALSLIVQHSPDEIRQAIGHTANSLKAFLEQHYTIFQLQSHNRDIIVNIAKEDVVVHREGSETSKSYDGGLQDTINKEKSDDCAVDAILTPLKSSKPDAQPNDKYVKNQPEKAHSNRSIKKAVKQVSQHLLGILKVKGPLVMHRITGHVCQAPEAAWNILREEGMNPEELIRNQSHIFYVSNTDVVSAVEEENILQQIKKDAMNMPEKEEASISVMEAKKQVIQHLVHILESRGPLEMCSITGHVNQAPEAAWKALKTEGVSPEELIRSQSYIFNVKANTDVVSLVDEGIDEAVDHFVSVIKEKGPIEVHHIIGHINQSPWKLTVRELYGGAEQFLRTMNHVFIVKDNVIALVQENHSQIMSTHNMIEVADNISQYSSASVNAGVVDESIDQAVDYFVNVIKKNGPLEMCNVIGHIEQAPGRQAVYNKYQSPDNFLRTMNHVFTAKAGTVSLVENQLLSQPEKISQCVTSDVENTPVRVFPTLNDIIPKQQPETFKHSLSTNVKDAPFRNIRY